MILGHSIGKDLNEWNLSQKVKSCKFSLASFPGAKLDCMNVVWLSEKPRPLYHSY